MDGPADPDAARRRADPGLRTPRTRAALAAALEAGLVDGEDAGVLDEAWVLATRVRNAVMLVRGRPGDTFPVGRRGNWARWGGTWATSPGTWATCSTTTAG